MYATIQDIIDIYGVDALLIVADRDNDGNVDAVVVDKALEDATAEIDSYLGQRARLPLETVPVHLGKKCVDIALYALSADSGYTEEKRKRYEDAIDWLKRFADGRVGLGLPDVDGTDTEPDPDATIEITSNPRLFNRDTGRKVF